MDHLRDLATPALVLDAAILEANIDRMAARADALGVPLRPHGKTPKCVEIGRMLCARSATGLTVSTLKEAEVYFAGGIRELFYAVALAPFRTGRVHRLLEAGAELICLTDHLEAACGIEAEARALGACIPLVIEIDVDGYRTGIAAGSSAMLELADFIHRSPHLRFMGLMSYGGASYGCRDVAATRALAETHRRALLESRDRLAAAGVACEMISFGSTPAVVHAESMEGVSELRCGIYAFQDLFQAAIGACGISDIALSVLATVIGVNADLNRITIDAGGLALSKDRSTATSPDDAAYGLVCDAETGALIPDLHVSVVSQEVGLVTTRSGAPMDMRRFPVGSRLRILPNHADMTAAAYEDYHVVRGDDRIRHVWTRENGW